MYGESVSPAARRPRRIEGDEGPSDSVDRLLAGWSKARPDLDFSPVAVVARLSRLSRAIDAELEATFAEHGLNAAEFYALVTLRRLDQPDGVSQRRLMRELNLSSGTVSTRVEGLVERGLVTRAVDPSDRRNSLVALTPAGLALFERVTPAHVNTENRLLAGLDPGQRDQLVELLRTLLVSLEGVGASPDATFPSLGLEVSPAHVTMHARRVVGLPETVGLLVRGVEPASRAEEAGALVGDVLTGADHHPLRTIASLYAAINRATGAGVLTLTAVRGENTPVTLAIDLRRRADDHPPPGDAAPPRGSRDHKL
jgi:DNA-binding MarR family transcriptional regulator